MCVSVLSARRRRIPRGLRCSRIVARSLKNAAQGCAVYARSTLLKDASARRVCEV